MKIARVHRYGPTVGVADEILRYGFNVCLL